MKTGWLFSFDFSCQGVRGNIEALVDNVLDPARRVFGGPVSVNSGYRCPKHNAEVGGVGGSQHLKGEAADICCGDNERLAGIIERNGRYDQLIRYMDGNGRVRFVHVSWKRCGVNRGVSLELRGESLEVRA